MKLSASVDINENGELEYKGYILEIDVLPICQETDLLYDIIKLVNEEMKKTILEINSKLSEDGTVNKLKKMNKK